jgi:hypothetical protein
MHTYICAYHTGMDVYYVPRDGGHQCEHTQASEGSHVAFPTADNSSNRLASESGNMWLANDAGTFMCICMCMYVSGIIWFLEDHSDAGTFMCMYVYVYVYVCIASQTGII